MLRNFPSPHGESYCIDLVIPTSRKFGPPSNLVARRRMVQTPKLVSGVSFPQIPKIWYCYPYLSSIQECGRFAILCQMNIFDGQGLLLFEYGPTDTTNIYEVQVLYVSFIHGVVFMTWEYRNTYERTVISNLFRSRNQLQFCPRKTQEWIQNHGVGHSAKMMEWPGSVKLPRLLQSFAPIGYWSCWWRKSQQKVTGTQRTMRQCGLS